MSKKADEWLDLTLKAEDPEKKLEYCTKYLELNPNDVDVWDYKGTILSKYLGRSREAMECYEKAADLIDEPSYLTGVVQLELNESLRATELFDDVLKKKPDDARAWLMKGRALIRSGNSEEALTCLDRALELKLSKVHEAMAWLQRGSALMNLRRFEEAIKCLNNSLEIDSGNAEAWLLKGSILLLDEMRRYDEALTCFNKVLEILKLHPDSEMFKLATNGKEIAEERLQTKYRAEGKNRKKKEVSTKKGLFKKLFG